MSDQPVSRDVADLPLPSPNTAPGSPAAAFMPEVLQPVEGHAGKFPIGPGNRPAVHLVDVVEGDGDWAGFQIAEPMQGATLWSSPIGESWRVDPRTGKITGRVEA